LREERVQGILSSAWGMRSEQLTNIRGVAGAAPREVLAADYFSISQIGDEDQASKQRVDCLSLERWRDLSQEVSCTSKVLEKMPIDSAACVEGSSVVSKELAELQSPN
jgi:hypothetical protein